MDVSEKYSVKRFFHCASAVINQTQRRENHYISSSQLRADQMPGPPREVQLTNDFFLASHHHVKASTKQSILMNPFF